MTQKKTVLVVEDDLDIRNDLREFLEIENHRVFTAENGRAALDLLQKIYSQVGVIILDLMMPVMTGEEFRMHQLESETLKHIPVIVITADVNALTRLKSLGIRYCLNKPFPLDHLASMIESSTPGSEISL